MTEFFTESLLYKKFNEVWPTTYGGKYYFLFGANIFKIAKSHAAWYIKPQVVFPHTKRYYYGFWKGYIIIDLD